MRWDCLQCANILHFCSLKILLIVVWVVGFVLLLRLVAVCRISYTYVYYLLLLFICIFFSLSLSLLLCIQMTRAMSLGLVINLIYVCESKKKQNKLHLVFILFFHFVYNKICASIRFNYVWSAAIN